jgi:diketogulonate reductase-like aldo/keto reductase
LLSCCPIIILSLSTEDPELAGIAARYGSSVAQLVLQWNIQRGVTVIPASLKRTELQENLALVPTATDDDGTQKNALGLALSTADMGAIATLDKGKAGRTLILEWGSSSAGELLAPLPTPPVSSSKL